MTIIGILSGLAIPKYDEAIDEAKVARAIGDLRALAVDVNAAPPAGARKDRFLVPINSAFDLYSVGKDGASAAPLTVKASQDDIVVANDGGFIGLARRY
jgi:type II secretory pathway pseudopilin PulG